MKKKADKNIKKLRVIGIMLITAILFTMPVSASANYGESAGKWLIDQIFWVGVIAVAIVVVGLLMKRNYTAMLITLGVSSVSLFILSDPQRLKSIGEAIWNTVFS